MYQLGSTRSVWLLAHDSQRILTEQISIACESRSNSDVRIVHKDWLTWSKFDDGFPNLFIENAKQIAGRDIILVASFHNVSVIFEQLSMMYALPRYSVQSLTVILPYFSTGTMERIDREGQVATAKVLAELLSNIPLTAGAPPSIIIFDIHDVHERFYFDRNVIPRLETAIPLIIAELTKLSRSDWMNDQIAIAFPDEGAEKRFRNCFPVEWSTIGCTKLRDGNKRVIRIREGDPRGKRVVIIDDLIQTGGTVAEAAKVIKDGGAKSVCAFVTHAVFPKNSWMRFVDGPIERFWITDSLPHAREIADHRPFELLPLAPLIADILLGTDTTTTTM